MTRFAIATSVWAPVEHEVPGDMGSVIQIALKAKFKRLKTSELKALHERIARREVSDAQVLELALQDWSDFADAQGQPVALTPDALAEACEEIPGLEAALVKAFFECVVNIKRDAITKNS